MRDLYTYIYIYSTYTYIYIYIHDIKSIIQSIGPTIASLRSFPTGPAGLRDADSHRWGHDHVPKIDGTVGHTRTMT